MDKSQEVINDFGDWNIINIKLVALDKEKKKVKRPFKLGQLNLVSTAHDPGFSGLKVKACYSDRMK